MTLLLLAGLTLMLQQVPLAAPAELLEVARVALARGDLAEAEARFRDLATDFPGDARAYTGLAETYVRQGRRPDALAVLVPVGAQMQQSGDAESARPILEMATTLAPEMPAARYFLGAVLTDLGEHAAAAEQFGTALELGDTQLATRVSLAAALWEAGDLEGAEHHYRAALGDGRDPVVLHQFATFLLFVGEPDEALGLLDEALRSSSAGPYLLLDRSRALARLGRQREAVEAARRAVEQAPSLAQAHYQLGTLLARAGETEEARTELEAVRRLNAETLAAQRETFRLQASLDEARNMLFRGDPEAALGVLADLPGSVATLEVRAAAYAALGRHAEAVAALERILALEPGRREVEAWLVRERDAG